MPGVRDTSIEAYEDIRDNGYLSESEQEVFDWFNINPKSTDKEISVMSRLDINVVTARRNDLVERGLIKGAGKRECKITGRIVMVWELGHYQKEKINCLTDKQMQNLQQRILNANKFQLQTILKLTTRRLGVQND